MSTATAPYEVTISGRRYPYSIWQFGGLTRDAIAVDTETTVVDGLAIPDLVLVTASTANRSVILPATLAADFIVTHRGCDFIGHNWAFDHHVLLQHFRRTDRHDALEVLLTAGDEHRLHDTQWLDALYQMARYDLPPKPRSLAVVAQEYAGITVDKEDVHRLRYHEIQGQRLQDVEDHGFLDYAVVDAIATYLTMSRLYHKAVEIAHRHDVPQAMIDTYGPLTESLQTNCAIVFADMQRRGIAVDLDRAKQQRSAKLRAITQLVAQIEDMPDAAGLFARKKDGSYKLTESGRPSFDQKNVLQPLLRRIANEHDIPAPETSRGITTSRKFWEDYRGAHPFIDAFCDLEELGKLYTFFSRLDSEEIHPRYNPLVKTGRSSSSNPNFQNMPKGDGFRSLFVARAGYQLMTLDFSAIELRTLAATCLDMFGESKLADAFHEGKDPHGLLAATFHNEPYEQFVQRADYKTLRSKVKAISFGCPGGMSPTGLAAYARSSYKTEITEDQAAVFRDTMINVTYPEIGRYLENDMLQVLADSTRQDRDVLRQLFGKDSVLGALRRVVTGRPHTRDGRDYDDAFVESLWRKLRLANQNPELAPLIENRDTQDLPKLLFGRPCKSLTGRIRPTASYTQSKNYCFQALASDGAKLGLWQLYRRGYRLVGFVHDEIVCEISDPDQAQEIERLLCDAMATVCKGVPVVAEYTISHEWEKP